MLLSLIVGSLIIAGGLFWLALLWLVNAGRPGARHVTLIDAVWPEGAWGLAAVALGVAIIYWS